VQILIDLGEVMTHS